MYDIEVIISNETINAQGLLNVLTRRRTAGTGTQS